MDDSPDLYRPHDIDFTYPPSREDFLAVVAQTPWMQVWQQDLLPLIAQNQWPMIDPGHKGATVELIDLSGRIAGRLEVWRKHRYCNAPYVVPFLGMYSDSAIDQFLKRRIRDREKRQQARQYLEIHRNLILERLARDPSPTQVLEEVERLLVDGGVLGKAKRAAVVA